MGISREIKFRAWNKITNEMHDVRGLAMSDESENLDLLDTSLTGELATHDYNDSDFYVLMQYTGRKDKNDKEIYDDDIVIDTKGRYGLVYWNLDDCQFVVDFQADLEIEQISSSYIICGNYWENVELLK